MSELINISDNRTIIRRKLLASVSSLALVASLSCATTAAKAEDSNPLIWIELGGQMDKVGGQGAVFAPPFLAANPTSAVLWKGATPLDAQRPPNFAFGEEGKLSFQPEESNWVFSAAIQIGRSGNQRNVHHQTYDIFYRTYKYGQPKGNKRGIDDFSDTQASRSETHAIVDFSAGKDVGLGLFGKNASSTVNLGVRFAQFSSKASFDIRARPDLQFKYLTLGRFGHPSVEQKLPYFHTYHATGFAQRNFHGVGPALSWNGSAPFAGNPLDGELTLDWGANAAILFGKQKSRARHVESAHYVTQFFVARGTYFTAYQPRLGGHSNVRNVTVPNVGGSFGMSWRLQDFKLSFGYRADIFFGATDTGIDAVKKSNLTFNGPYASVSIGLGD